MKAIRFLVLAALLPAAGVPAQDLLRLPPSAAVLRGYDLAQGELQQLQLPADGAEHFRVAVMLGNRRVELSVRKHDVRAPNYKLVVDDGLMPREVTPGPVITYRGLIDGEPGSTVAATLQRGQLSAYIVDATDKVWGIEPATRYDGAYLPSTHVVFARTDLRLPPSACGTDTHGHDDHHGGAGGSPQALRIAEIALDCDFTYYQSNGSSVPNTEADATTVMNAVDAIYQRDVEIQYTITTIIVRTAQVYSGSSLQSLLQQMLNRWNANHGGVQRDVAHLFVDRGVRSGVIGIAYLGVVCNVGNAYGVSATRFTGSLTGRAGLTAHEIGHNWNANHCDAVSDCRIMCSGLGGCSGNVTSFAPVSVNAIVAWKNSVGCLTSPQPPTLTSATPSSVTSWQPAEVTLTGTRLDTVTSIQIGGAQLTNFTIVSPTQIRFRPSAPTMISTSFLAVRNGGGISNLLLFTTTGNHPSVMQVPNVAVRGTPFAIRVHSDVNWLGALLVSTSNQPSVFPGIVSLGIGNNFTNLIQLGVVPCGPDGTSATVNVTVPTSLPPLFRIYWQAITLNGASPSFPLEASDVAFTDMF